MFPLYELHEVERGTPPPPPPHTQQSYPWWCGCLYTYICLPSLGRRSVSACVGLMGRRQAAGPPLGHRGQTDLFNDTNKNQ